MGAALGAAARRHPVRQADEGAHHRPVLHLQGAADPTVLPSSARGSGDFVTGRYAYAEIDSVGHFPHEERPEEFNATLLDWLTTT